jgi:hypothetical protein
VESTVVKTASKELHYTLLMEETWDRFLQEIEDHKASDRKTAL